MHNVFTKKVERNIHTQNYTIGGMSIDIYFAGK